VTAANEHENLADEIARAGWVPISTAAKDAHPEGGPVNYLYTLGLQQSYDWPELLVFGLHPAGAANLLDDIVETARSAGTPPKAGATFQTQAAGTRSGIGVQLRLTEIHRHWIEEQALTPVAVRYYGHPVPFLQVQWPAPSRAFPGEGFPPELGVYQPNLGNPPPPPGLFTPRGHG
jgi:hypothetical protein